MLRIVLKEQKTKGDSLASIKEIYWSSFDGGRSSIGDNCNGL
jgi:hypothetical protein